MIKNFEEYINEDYFSKLASRKDNGERRIGLGKYTYAFINILSDKISMEDIGDEVMLDHNGGEFNIIDTMINYQIEDEIKKGNIKEEDAIPDVYILSSNETPVEMRNIMNRIFSADFNEVNELEAYDFEINNYADKILDSYISTPDVNKFKSLCINHNVKFFIICHTTTIYDMFHKHGSH